MLTCDAQLVSSGISSVSLSMTTTPVYNLVNTVTITITSPVDNSSTGHPDVVIVIAVHPIPPSN